MKQAWPKWEIILGLMVILGAAAALQSGAVSLRSRVREPRSLEMTSRQRSTLIKTGV